MNIELIEQAYLLNKNILFNYQYYINSFVSMVARNSSYDSADNIPFELYIDYMYEKLPCDERTFFMACVVSEPFLIEYFLNYDHDRVCVALYEMSKKGSDISTRSQDILRDINRLKLLGL